MIVLFSLWRKISQVKSIAIGGVVLLVGFSCSAPRLDFNTDEGKQAILDQVDIFLTDEKCEEAIELIEPLYQSNRTDDNVRYARAAAYGCVAKVNYFKNVGELASGNITGAALWATITQMYNSEEIGSPDLRNIAYDKQAEAGFQAMDALMAVLEPGAVVPSGAQINWSSSNPGSLIYSDRADDANGFAVFVAMASLGALNNRFGSPDTSYQKTGNLPWETTATMDDVGCGYAGQVLNMLDGAAAMADSASGSVQTILNTVKTFQTFIDYACLHGCLNSNIAASGLTFDMDTGSTATSCATTCPIELRERSGCDDNAERGTGTANVNKGAAAGIVRWMNMDPLGWLCTGSASGGC